MSFSFQGVSEPLLLKRKGDFYRSEIDGLRALAVMVVVLFHADLGCPGGFVGVDVFFVISGYLITAIILRDLENDQFSFSSFWNRRVRRIYPAMSFCMLSTLVVGAVWLLPSDAGKLGLSSISQIFVSSNLYFWRNTNYFGDDIFEKPLLHTWSLSVEEQFYIFFPVLLWGLWQFFKQGEQKIRCVGLIFVLMGMSFLLSIWAVKDQPYAAFYLLPTRAWELLGGALLVASKPTQSTRAWIQQGMALIGLGTILFPVFCYDDKTAFPGMNALLPCLGTMLILRANEKDSDDQSSAAPTLVGQILSLKPLKWIGLISYSLYLWHWPLIVYAKYWILTEPSLVMRFGWVGISIILAFLSWKWIETPVRSGRQWEGARLWRNSGIMTGFLICSAWALKAEWFVTKERQLAVDQIQEVEKEKAAFYKASLDRWDARTSLEAILNDDLSRLGPKNGFARIDFALLGDSHAYQLVQLADELAKDLKVTGVIISHEATSPLLQSEFAHSAGFSNPEVYAQAQLEYVRNNEIKTVILCANWAMYSCRMKHFHEHFIATIRAYEAAGSKVFVLMSSPTYPTSLVRSSIRNRFFWGAWKDADIAQTLVEHQHNNEAMYQLAHELNSATFVDPSPEKLAREDSTLAVTKGGRFLYFDGSHLNQRGVYHVWYEALRSVLVKTVDAGQKGNENSSSLNQ